jgi:hypothetical protein
MKFSPDGYHPKLWSPITIDPQLWFMRVIPFWNVQVMLYNIDYLKNILKESFFQGTVALAVRCISETLTPKIPWN